MIEPIRHWLRPDFGAVVPLALATLGCYGTLALLSLAGIALAVNEAAFGGLVVALAVLAVVGWDLRQRRRGRAPGRPSPATHHVARTRNESRHA